ncbi:hypothetical protein ASZ90_004098 [hydrocarbon metagenome]|uniref:PIN domain-containing protein n=1 Tax=hydrocarbon metagenome TaxID=938273 RepID=A0A0W8FYW5_9ZZZZ
MSEKKKEYMIDTDVFISHLLHKAESKSLLEKVMECGICFTTVINSAELNFASRNKEEKKLIDALMRSVKVLGFHSRYSLSVDEFIGKVDSVRDALFCATAKINKLPIVTLDDKRYSLTELEIINPENL